MQKIDISYELIIDTVEVDEDHLVVALTWANEEMHVLMHVEDYRRILSQKIDSPGVFKDSQFHVPYSKKKKESSQYQARAQLFHKDVVADLKTEGQFNPHKRSQNGKPLYIEAKAYYRQPDDDYVVLYHCSYDGSFWDSDCEILQHPYANFACETIENLSEFRRAEQDGIIKIIPDDFGKKVIMYLAMANQSIISLNVPKKKLMHTLPTKMLMSFGRIKYL